MIALPYWITSQLAIVPRPHGGPSLNTEMLALREAGIDVVVSMLQQEEAHELGLEAEEVSAQKVGLLFMNFPIPDADIPADKLRFNTFLSDLETHLANGRRIGIHCRGCIGRSAVTAAGLMIRSGIPPESAWLQIATSRGCPVPGTLEQREWVDRHIRPNSMATPEFPHSWRIEVLKAPPLIAPARQLTYPRQIAGEEDALARGALQLLVRPATGGIFLATCALGFTNPAMPTGIFPCPNPDELCAVAGGYAYIIDTLQPEQSTHISLKPVTEVRSLPDNNLILFIGFHTIVAWGPQGQAWESARLSWEGIRISEVAETILHGTGWNLLTDKEVPFALDLLTGQHQGGGFAPPPGTQKA